MTIRPIAKRARGSGSGWRSVVVLALGASTLIAYLFVTAPPPLATAANVDRTVPIAAILSVLELENDAARALWTQEIVDRGIAVGLAFGERWREAAVHEGPLPALFLRETARQLERSAVRLRLFLGSHQPINAANKLTGAQATTFVALEHTGAPQFFFDASTAMHTAMFADRAVVERCVTCHNQHRASPKSDWRLHDVMGATTWMYPDGAVSAERAIEMIRALRASTRAAYASYLDKAATFPRAPVVGDRWPRDGYYVPSADAFMAELARRTSAATVQGLIDPSWALTAAADERVARAAGSPAIAAPPAAPAVAPAAPSAPATGAPLLVVRAARATRVSISKDGSRIMVVRLPAGGATSLSARPPLRLTMSQRAGVEVEYAGKRVAFPAATDAAAGDGEFELELPITQERS